MQNSESTTVNSSSTTVNSSSTAKSKVSSIADFIFKAAIVCLVIYFLINLANNGNIGNPASTTSTNTTSTSTTSTTLANNTISPKSSINWVTSVPDVGKTELPTATCSPSQYKFPYYGIKNDQTLCINPDRIEIVKDKGFIPEYFKENVVNNCPTCLGMGPECTIGEGPYIVSKMKDHNDYAITCSLCNSKTLYLSTLTDDKMGDDRSLQCRNLYQPRDQMTL